MLVRYLLERGYEPFLEMPLLVVHEVGHVVLGLSGSGFWGFAGGTIFQLLIPAYVVINFWRRREWFGVQFGWVWLGVSCMDIADYAGDAQARSLPLVPLLSPEPIHDWWWMLNYLGILEWDWLVSGMFWWVGIGMMVWGIGWGGWLVREMILGYGNHSVQ